MRPRTTVWISSGMRQAPLSLVDRGWSRRVNAWASLFMNNSCPVLVKRMMPVAPCCGRLCARFFPLSGPAIFSAVMIDICPPSFCTRRYCTALNLFSFAEHVVVSGLRSRSGFFVELGYCRDLHFLVLCADQLRPVKVCPIIHWGYN